jgi:hypothetical protein
MACSAISSTIGKKSRPPITESALRNRREGGLGEAFHDRHQGLT